MKTQYHLSRLVIVLNVSSVILKAVTTLYSIQLQIKGEKEALPPHQRGFFLGGRNSPGKG